MILNSKEQRTIREYLLGGTSQVDSLRVEDRLLTDNAFYEELVMAEDELIDQYLNDVLSQSERQSFETHFLAAPERQKKLRFARVFQKYVTTARNARPDQADAVDEAHEAEWDTVKAPPKRQPFFPLPCLGNPVVSYSLVAVIVMIFVCGSWLVLREKDPPPREPGKVFAVALTPGLTRDYQQPITQVPIAFGIDTVQLQLVLPQVQHDTYEAAVQDASGHTLITQKNLKPANDRPAVFVEVAASLIPPGDYRVRLNGLLSNGDVEGVSSYSFRVVNK